METVGEDNSNFCWADGLILWKHNLAKNNNPLCAFNLFCDFAENLQHRVKVEKPVGEGSGPNCVSKKEEIVRKSGGILCSLPEYLYPKRDPKNPTNSSNTQNNKLLA